jgi:hypothetical protein
VAGVPVAAGARDTDSERDGVLIGLGATLCTLVYGPVKVAYAAGGLAVGSLAWLWSFGNKRVAKPIFQNSLGGDYVVLPDHLRGKQKLRFRGGR